MASIATKRLRLRPPSQADLSDYLAYRNDTAALLAQGMTATTEDEASAFLASQGALPDDARGWRMFAVERSRATDLIGEVEVFRPEGDAAQGDIGWWFHPDHRGQGYATEAAKALIEWCFADCGLHRLTASCLASNIASRRVMHCAGMRLESRLVESCFREGRWYDEVSFALLRREWEMSR